MTETQSENVETPDVPATDLVGDEGAYETLTKPKQARGFGYLLSIVVAASAFSSDFCFGFAPTTKAPPDERNCLECQTPQMTGKSFCSKECCAAFKEKKRLTNRAAQRKQ